MNSSEIFSNFEKNNNYNFHDFTVLQIGANDGVQDDIIRDFILKYNPISHLIEPIKYIYDNLIINYTNCSNVTCHNIAISDINGYKDMTTLEYDISLPIWCKGLSTFDENKNFFSGYGGSNLSIDLRKSELFKIINERKYKVNVQTKKLETFLNDNNIDTIDIFVSDTEGHDYIIFEQLDFTKYTPKVIIIETHTLGEDINNLIKNKLIKFGYEIFDNNWDIIGLK